MITFNLYLDRIEVIEDGKITLQSSTDMPQILHRLAADLFMAYVHSGLNRGYQFRRLSRIINNLDEMVRVYDIVHDIDINEDNIVNILRDLFLFVRRRKFYSINLNIINHV